MAPIASVATVHEAEERIRADRANANEIIDLLDLSETGAPRVRLAAVQSCRAVFMEWAASGMLVLSLAADDPTSTGASEGESPRLAFRRWVLEQYRRFVATLRRMLQRTETPPGLSTPALDSLVQMAALEARHSPPADTAAASAFEAPRGAFAQLVAALGHSARAQPKVLERLAEAHLPQLDVAYHMLRAIQRLAKGIGAPRPAAPQSRPASAARLIDLLLLMAPPRTDPPPEEALLLVRPMGGVSTWGGAARDALTAKKHRFELARCWRALLALPLSDALYHRALRALPAAVLPHVARPLQFCDLLSDGYARGGVDALLSLKGLFVLMQKHNLEYPRFYSRLYTLLSPGMLDGEHRAEFANELQLFLSSTGLPVYLLAAFCKRLSRLALHGSPPAAALGLALIFNLLLRHPAARVVVHAPRAGEPGAEAAAARAIEAPPLDAAAPGAADPYLSDEEEPEKCHAVRSSLWEVDSLRAHYCPTVASLASLFAAPMTHATQPIPIEPMLDMSYRSLAQLETRKRLRSVPLNARPPLTPLCGDDGRKLAGWS